jgi:hypothetical protein
MTTATDSEGQDRNRLVDAAAGKPLTPDSLVGSFFHSDVGRGWQGCVVAEPGPGVYLLERFEWLVGSSDDQVLMRLEDMIGWSFYDTAEWMNSAYRNGVQRRWEHERVEDRTPEDGAAERCRSAMRLLLSDGDMWADDLHHAIVKDLGIGPRLFDKARAELTFTRREKMPDGTPAWRVRLKADGDGGAEG